MASELLDLGENRVAVFKEKERNAEHYTGIERRAAHRRNQADRRHDMRFELDKPDRRAVGGRRATDQRPKFF